MPVRKIRAWWDRQCNWEYYATLDFVRRTVPAHQIYTVGADGQLTNGRKESPAVQQKPAAPNRTAAQRISALEQQVALQRVAIAALSSDGDHRLMAETAETGPIKSILLNHSAITRRATLTMTQQGGTIQSIEMPNVRAAEVKVTTAQPSGDWLALQNPPWVLPEKRVMTITLELQ